MMTVLGEEVTALREVPCTLPANKPFCIYRRLRQPFLRAQMSVRKKQTCCHCSVR